MSANGGRLRNGWPPWMGRGDLFGAALFALALAPRLAVAFTFAAEPVWDAHYYDFGAHRIAAGFGYSDDLTVDGHAMWHPWCHYPVGYSAFLAGVYRLFGDGQHVGVVANSVVGAALALVVWRLGRYGLSEARARVAGVLVAVHPGLILYGGILMTEPLAALLTLTAFWLGVRFRNELTAIAGAALMLGISALVRPQALLCAPFLALRMPRQAKSRALGLVMACALAIVPVVPWTIRNCTVMDGCAFISTNTGWNLAIGSFPRATGRFETLRASDGCSDVTGQVQQDRCWLHYGVGEILARPLRWIALIPEKWSQTFDHESFAVEYFRQARPFDWPEARRNAWRAASTSAHRLLICAAAFSGIAFRLRGVGASTQGALSLAVLAFIFTTNAGGSPTFWPLVLFTSIVPWLPLPGRPSWTAALLWPLSLLGTTLLAHAVFFGEDRYHIVVAPALCLLAAAGLRRGEFKPANPKTAKV